jgi:hypothetical protein
MGTTDAKSRLVDQTQKDCSNSIAQEYQKKQREADGERRVGKGLLNIIINKKKREFGVHEDHYISHKTIRARLYRKQPVTIRGGGVQSPLADIEQVFVDLCRGMGKIRQPLTVMESMVLMNSLIDGTVYQKRLIEYKLRRGSQEMNNDDLGKVGRGWWDGFIKRHKGVLVTKRGERFACNRADWTKRPYIKQMYDVVYDEMVDAGVARKRANPVFMLWTRKGMRLVTMMQQDMEGRVLCKSLTQTIFCLPTSPAGILAKKRGAHRRIKM